MDGVHMVMCHGWSPHTLLLALPSLLLATICANRFMSNCFIYTNLYCICDDRAVIIAACSVVLDEIYSWPEDLSLIHI